MFLLLPVFAALTFAAWRRRAPRYFTHLYTALHLHAAWFAALALATYAGVAATRQRTLAALAFPAFAYMAWHTLVALHRVFGEGWGRTAAKAALVGGAYVAVVSLVGLGLLSLAVLTS
jgi:hypothetical protein